MDKYQQVIIDYAANRIELRKINSEIDKATFGDSQTRHMDNYIDLSSFRDDWYGESGEYGSSPRWEGWVMAVEVSDHKPEELALAKLLDERSKIKRKGGKLKRKICAYGRALITRKINN